MNKDYLLKASKICKIFSNKIILQDIDLIVREGEILTLIGPNGGGKTTLAKILAKIIPYNSGKLWFKKDISIGYMPQKIAINKNIPMTVLDFLELNINTIKNNFFNELTVKTGINKILDYSIHNISGGEMQRVLLTRCLLKNNQLLILDEPEQGVDINGQIEIYKLLEKINIEFNVAIILISHDLHLVMKKTNYVICLNHHICCEGMPNYIKDQQSFKELFDSKISQSLAFYTHNHDHNHDISE